MAKNSKIKKRDNKKNNSAAEAYKESWKFIKESKRYIWSVVTIFIDAQFYKSDY